MNWKGYGIQEERGARAEPEQDARMSIYKSGTPRGDGTATPKLKKVTPPSIFPSQTLLIKAKQGAVQIINP